MSYPQFKTQFGEKWEKIFYHDFPQSSVFTYQEALECHETYKFSNLKKLSNHTNLYYEFLLEYPGLKGYNRWIQKKNPLETINSETNNDTGFIPLALTWTENFGGLQLMNLTTDSFLDCDVRTGHNWYAIATYRHYEAPNSFPGPMEVVNSAILYLRVPNKVTCRGKRTIPRILFITIFLQ